MSGSSRRHFFPNSLSAPSDIWTIDLVPSGQRTRTRPGLMCVLQVCGGGSANPHSDSLLHCKPLKPHYGCHWKESVITRTHLNNYSLCFRDIQPELATLGRIGQLLSQFCWIVDTPTGSNVPLEFGQVDITDQSVQFRLHLPGHHC